MAGRKRFVSNIFVGRKVAREGEGEGERERERESRSIEMKEARSDLADCTRRIRVEHFPTCLSNCQSMVGSVTWLLHRPV